MIALKIRLGTYLVLWVLAALALVLIVHDPLDPSPDAFTFKDGFHTFLKAPVTVAFNLAMRLRWAFPLALLFLGVHPILVFTCARKRLFLTFSAVQLLLLGIAVASFADYCWYHPPH